VRWRRPREHAFAGCARRRARGVPVHTTAAALECCGFSVEAYVSANPDLRQLPDADAAMMHFIAIGIDEGRQFPIRLDLDGLSALGELDLAPEFTAAARAILVNNMIAPGASFWKRTAPEQRAFWARLIPILQGMASPYFIIGDSHSGLYRYVISSSMPLLPVHVLTSACSAIGLGNPDSRSGAARRLEPLSDVIDVVPVIFKFGQVDVEFVHAFRRIEAGHAVFDPNDFGEFCRRSVRSYVDFLQNFGRRRSHFVASIFPPTLSDEAWRQGYVNAHVAMIEGDRPLEELRAGVRQLQVPSLPDRTRHHAQYNEILREQVDRAGLDFIDDFSPFIGPGGVVDPKFIPLSAGRDHHLERPPTAPIIKRIIATVVATHYGVHSS
jgi:hypothetical protein